MQHLFFSLSILHTMNNLNYEYHLTFDLIEALYLVETPFNTFANRADPDQAALVRAV